MIIKKVFSSFLSFFKEAPDKAEISDPKEISKQYTYYRIRMFYSMYIAYVFYYFTRKNISPALHVFAKEMDISITELGIMGSIFYITYGIGKFLSGILADKAGIRPFLVFGLFASSILNLIFGSLQTVWIMSFIWGLNGIFQSMGFPPVAKGLVAWYAPKERATLWTIWSSSHTAGTFFIGIIVAFLLNYFGWRSAFYVPGVLGLLTSIFLWNRLKDTPKSLGLPKIDKYKNDEFPVKLEDNKLSQFQILKKHVFTNPFIWSLCIAYIFVYLVRFGTLDWATKFMYDERGIEKVRVAFMWSIMPLFGMPGGIVAGRIADKYFNGRCTPINIIYLIFLAFSILGFYYYASMENFYLTCFLLAAIGFFVDGPQNLIGGVQVSRVTVPEAVSGATGFSGMFGYVGAIISGFGLALITENFGWVGMYWFCALSCIIAAIFVSFTWKKEKADSKRVK